MAHVVRYLVLRVMPLFVAICAAQADTSIGVRTILPAQPEHELLARQFRAGLEGELSILLTEAQQAGKCEVRIYDISDYNIETREKEKIMQDTGLIDPTTMTPIEGIPVNTFVDGVVGTSQGELDYILDVSGMDGASIAKLEGSFKQEDILSKIGEVARALFEKLCPGRPFRVQGGMNDLVIDQTVCDVTKSFVLHGKGAAAGISLTLQPAGEGSGSFSVSGTAAGVLWSGGGTYTLAMNDGGGALDLTGDWKISTPVGNFPGGGTIKTKLTPAEDCKQPAPAKAKKKKKKK